MRVFWPDVRKEFPMVVPYVRCTAAVTFLLLWGIADGSEPPARNPAAAPAAERSRSFRMGFTAFPHDISLEAMEETRQLVRTNADLIAHHMEGVPWTEALRDAPFPKEVLREHESQRSRKPPGAKVYLALSPGRGDLKRPDQGGTPRPPERKGKAYDDPLGKKAYLT